MSAEQVSKEEQSRNIKEAAEAIMDRGESGYILIVKGDFTSENAEVRVIESAHNLPHEAVLVTLLGQFNKHFSRTVGGALMVGGQEEAPGPSPEEKKDEIPETSAQ